MSTWHDKFKNLIMPMRNYMEVLYKFLIHIKLGESFEYLIFVQLLLLQDKIFL